MAIYRTKIAITEDNNLIDKIFNTLKLIAETSFEGSYDEDFRSRLFKSSEGSFRIYDYKEYGKDTYHYKICYSSIKAPGDEYVICDNYYSVPGEWTIDYHRFTSVAFNSLENEKVEAFNILEDDSELLKNTVEKICNKINKVFKDSKTYEEEEARKEYLKKKETLTSILEAI